MKVKKIITVFLLGILSGFSSQAQTMSEIFTKIPNDLVLFVDSIKRLDLMDLHKARKIAQISDNLSDTCMLKSFSENYLLLKIGKTSTEIVLLPMINDSKIVCLIRTVCAPICDSRLDFYTVGWKKLDTHAFISPAEVSWFIKEGTDKSDPGFLLNSSLLNMSLMQFNFDKSSMTLIQTYTTPEYLSEEDRGKVKPYLKNQPKVFNWENMRFK